MRRTDREVTDPAEITEMMTRCEVLHLALNTDTVPYILPVNFGMEPDGMTLYIHGAWEGTKYTLIEKDNCASFELDCTHGLVHITQCVSVSPSAPAPADEVHGFWESRQCCMGNPRPGTAS